MYMMKQGPPGMGMPGVSTQTSSQYPIVPSVAVVKAYNKMFN